MSRNIIALWFIIFYVCIQSCGIQQMMSLDVYNYSDVEIESISNLEEVLDTQEYAVLSAVVDSIYSGWEIESVVVYPITNPGAYGHPVYYLRDHHNWSDFQARRDWKKKNKNQSYTLLANHFTSKNEVYLYDEDKISQVAKPKLTGWEAFYNAYPNSQGLLRFSRVGFNNQNTVAMIYIESQSYLMNGFGEIIKLVKIENKWVIADRIHLWMS